ncbi:MAG: HAD-IIIA family hydrolase [Bacteroidia bacterium]|nr:HAD-IIIA family hydrolase [Bacteroidia bacterium]
MNLIYDKLINAKAFIFDVDGVMTTGQVLVTEEGMMLRSFNIKDGYAIQHAVKAGYPICIISGGKSSGITKRFEVLGVKDIYIGQSDKQAAYDEFKTKYNLADSDIIYMGDDMPDLPIMKQVGIACCPADAAVDILQVANYISPLNGGQGCVRDILEKTLKLQKLWMNDLSFTW